MDWLDHFAVQGTLDAGYRMLGAGALRWPRGPVWGGQREGGSGLGTRVHLWRIHVDIWQNQYNIVKKKSLKVLISKCFHTEDQGWDFELKKKIIMTLFDIGMATMNGYKLATWSKTLVPSLCKSFVTHLSRDSRHTFASLSLLMWVSWSRYDFRKKYLSPTFWNWNGTDIQEIT